MNSTYTNSDIYESEVVGGVLLVKLKSNVIRVLTEPLRFAELYSQVESPKDSLDLCGYVQLNDSESFAGDSSRTVIAASFVNPFIARTVTVE